MRMPRQSSDGSDHASVLTMDKLDAFKPGNEIDSDDDASKLADKPRVCSRTLHPSDAKQAMDQSFGYSNGAASTDASETCVHIWQSTFETLHHCWTHLSDEEARNRCAVLLHHPRLFAGLATPFSLIMADKAVELVKSCTLCDRLRQYEMRGFAKAPIPMQFAMQLQAELPSGALRFALRERILASTPPERSSQHVMLRGVGLLGGVHQGSSSDAASTSASRPRGYVSISESFSVRVINSPVSSPDTISGMYCIQPAFSPPAAGRLSGHISKASKILKSKVICDRAAGNIVFIGEHAGFGKKSFEGVDDVETVIGKIARGCSATGASAVIIELPQRHWHGIPLTGYTASFDKSWLPGMGYKLTDWGAELSCNSFTHTVPIPVVLILKNVADKLRKNLDHARSYSNAVVMLELVDTISVRTFKDGNQLDLPPLSDLVSRHFSMRSTVDNALSFLDEMRSAPWSFDEYKIVSLLEQTFDRTNFWLQFVVVKHIESAADRPLQQLIKFRMALVSEFVFTYQWDAPSLERALDSSLCKELTSELRPAVAGHAVMQKPFRLDERWATLLFCAFCDPHSRKAMLDDFVRNIRSEEEILELGASVQRSIDCLGRDVFTPSDFELVVTQLEPWVQSLDLLSVVLSIGGVPFLHAQSAVRLQTSVVRSVVQKCRTSTELESAFEQCKRHGLVPQFETSGTTRVLEFDLGSILEWVSSDAFGEVRIPAIPQLYESISSMLLASPSPTSIDDILVLLAQLRIHDVSAAKAHEANILARLGQLSQDPRRLNGLVISCKERLGDEGIKSLQGPAVEIVLQSHPREIRWWLTESAAFQDLKAPSVLEVCRCVGQQQATLADHLALFETLKKLDPSAASRTFPSFIKPFVQEQQTPCELERLLTDCIEAMGEEVVEVFKSRASAVVLESDPRGVLWWLESASYKRFHIPSIEELCKGIDLNRAVLTDALQLLRELHRLDGSLTAAATPAFVRKHVSQCHSSKSLDAFVDSCKKVMGTTLDEPLRQSCNEAVLKFPPREIVLWLDTVSCEQLEVPTIRDVCGISEQWRREPFAEVMDLFSHLHKIDSGVASPSCGDFIVAHITANQQLGILDGLSMLNEPVVQLCIDEVIDCLSSSLPGCFQGANWNRDRTSFCQQVCETFNRLVPNEAVRSATEKLVVSLLPNVRLADPAAGLSTVWRHATSLPSYNFLVRLCTRCATRSKLLTSFDSLDSLLDALDEWRLVNPQASLLAAWIDLTRKIVAEPNSDEARALQSDYLRPLLRKCEDMFSADAIDRTRVELFRRCDGHRPALHYLERECATSKHLQWFTRLEQSMQKWQTAIDSLQHHCPRLETLQPYLPSLVATLEHESRFRAKPSEAEGQSCETLQQRAHAVATWLQPLTTSTNNRHNMLHHFVVNASHSANARSILFAHWIADERKRHGGEWQATDAFAQSIDAVRGMFLKLLRLGRESLSFDELRDVARALKDQDRAPDKELELLGDFPDFAGARAADVREDLGVVLQLHGLASPLATVPIALQRHDFACASRPDADLDEIRGLAKSLADAEVTRGWTVEQCRAKLVVLRRIVCSDANAQEELVGLLTLFERLNRADKAWEFVHLRKEYISSSGDGYSGAFHDKVEDFLSQLGGEEHKILENFKPVVAWLAILAHHHQKPFGELMQAIRESKLMMMQARQTRPFSQLDTAESNMAFLSTLFEKGLGGLDSVLWQYQSIRANCVYIFDLERAELRLTYTDEHKQQSQELSEQEVLDLEQRLGFVQHEENAQEHNIAQYLQQLHEYRRTMTVMCELHSLGHRDWKRPMSALAVGRPKMGWPERVQHLLSVARPVTEAELRTIDATSSAWADKLDAVMKENKLLCLFSSRAAQHMSKLVTKKSVRELTLMLSSLFPRTSKVVKCLSTSVSRAVHASDATMDWPDQTTAFLEAVAGNMRSHGLANTLTGIPPATQQIGDGPLRYTATSSHASVLRVLLHIFKDRPPESCEILWCDERTTSRSLLGFLQCARHHPGHRFVLLQVDALPPALQHILLRAFLDSRNSSISPRVGHNLHCIETGACMLQSATWVALWDADEVCDGVDLESGLSKWVFHEDDCIRKVTCFHGPPGSGKTHQLRKELSALDGAVTKCALSITEAFSLKYAATKLQAAAMEAGDGEIAISVQIQLGKFKASELDAWTRLMRLINKFFFKLLVLRSIEADTVFNVPPSSKLKVFVEIPDRCGHLQELEACSTSEIGWIADEIPVLAASSTFRDATRAPFDVNEAATHVSKYLKSYEDGSIDQLYGSDSSGPKDVMFVMDNSGSMGDSIQGEAQSFFHLQQTTNSWTALEVCKNCLLDQILPQRLSAIDSVGFIAFNHSINVDVRLDSWQGAHRAHLESKLRSVMPEGQTNMWTAVDYAVRQLLQSSGKRSKWLVALTDGASHDNAHDVERLLNAEGKDVHVLFITVNLSENDRRAIETAIRRTENDGMFSASDVSSLEQAWKDVGERLTVSQRIEKQGESITTAETERLLRKYMKLDGAHSCWSRMKQMHWIQYLYRRCGILAASETFNKNQDKPAFGSTTMTIMLEEVELALAQDYQVDWHSTNHEQLVYCREEVMNEGKRSWDYKWSILATRPDATEAAWLRRRELLVKTLKMTVPTKEDLRDRRVLESYLGHGLGVDLAEAETLWSSCGHPFDFEIGSLPLISERKFVLTLDFTMKMLCMNERIACRVPCIMEGETGVSKTALTRMLFLLKNTATRTISTLEDTIRGAVSVDAIGLAEESEDERSRRQLLSALRLLADFWRVTGEHALDECWRSIDHLAETVCSLKLEQIADSLIAELRADPSLDPLSVLSEQELSLLCEPGNGDQRQEVVATLLKWYVMQRLRGLDTASSLDWTFYPIDVHAALTPSDIADDPRFGVNVMVKRAERLLRTAEILDSERHRNITLCLFLDEVNTSSCMGVFKELVIDHSLDGRQLPKNIVVIAACNPARDKIERMADRREELGNEWVIGHYQVHPLPASMQQMTWDFGALKPAQEEEFIRKKLNFLIQAEAHEDPTERSSDFAAHQVEMLSDLVYVSQQVTREFAKEHIRSIVQQKQSDSTMGEDELVARASSSVSLRDILRVFDLYKFLMSAPEKVSRVLLPHATSPRSRRRLAVLLSLGVVYYLRLGTNGASKEDDFRRKFRNRLASACGAQDANVEEALCRTMSALMDQTFLDDGIASTRGLQENVFMVIVCCLANIPLMIVGPPGSSKTLAVTVVAENARGAYSKSDFYKAIPALVPFHYQCSRRSSSYEISLVFERAIERQVKASREDGNMGCFVFMDEAGLPEEERESLKVLHYYLEDHMAVAARVGFVAISNHLLDAAKSNRCALLTRAKPDKEELMNVARGCLGRESERRALGSTVPGVRRGKPITVDVDPSLQETTRVGLLDFFCECYDACMSEKPLSRALLGDYLPVGELSPPADFVSFFGLRDFMHFVKQLGRLARSDHNTITRDKIEEALERNLNGVDPKKLREILQFFVFPYPDHDVSARSPPCDVYSHGLRNPLTLMRKSIAEQAAADTPICRYKLVIDTTADDSILRAISKELGAAKVLKLSRFPDDSSVQQINAISQVKLRAELGQIIVLSQTESVNESFYDLFNQHFRKFEDRREHGIEVSYHANIAVGAHSRRCKVSLGFQCIVHLSLPELQLAPAPFLNRFEKYRITHAHLLEAFLQPGDHRHSGPEHILEHLPALKVVLSRSERGLMAHLLGLVDLLGLRSFYGFAPHQTIESALMCIISKWKSSADVASCVAQHLERKGFRSSVDAELGDESVASALRLEGKRRILEVLCSPVGEMETRIQEVLLAQTLLTELTWCLLRVAVPEKLFQYPGLLPADLLHEYLHQKEHFSLAGLLQCVLSHSVRKHVVYTRTSAEVLALQTGSTPAVPQLAGSLLDFSQLTREAQLTDALCRFLDPTDSRQVLFICVDATRIAVSQVNFIRYKVDEIMAVEQDKSIVILLHVPASNLLVEPCYETTHCEEWASTFLDNVHAEDVTAWISLATGLADLQEWHGTMRAHLELWLPRAVDTIARFVELPDALLGPEVLGGTLERRRAWCGRWLDTTLHSCAVRDILLSRFQRMWAGDDDSYERLKQHIHSKVVALATGTFHGSLLDALTRQVRDMFTKFLLHMACESCAQSNGCIFLWHADQLGAFAPLVEDCIRALRSPPLAELTAELRTQKVLVPPTFAPHFPFFAHLARILDLAAAQALVVYAEYEEADVWKVVVDDVVARVRGHIPAFGPADEGRTVSILDDGTATVDGVFRHVNWGESKHGAMSGPIKSVDPHGVVVLEDGREFENPEVSIGEMNNVVITHLLGETNEALWERYVLHFVGQLQSLPEHSTSPLQQLVLRGWLLNHEGVRDADACSRIAALHVVAQWHDRLLKKMADSIAPLATVASHGVQEKVVAIMDGSEDVEAELNAAMVDAFYVAMLERADPLHATMPRLREWSDAFGVPNLLELPRSTRGVDFMQLQVMGVVHAVIRACDDGGDRISQLVDAIQKLHQFVSSGGGQHLSISDTWGMLQHAIDRPPPSLVERLVFHWAGSARSEVDLNCLLDMICDSSLSVAQRVPMLEALLFGRAERALPDLMKRMLGPHGSFLDLLRLPDNSAHEENVSVLLNQRLRCELQGSIPAVVPYWLGGDSSAKPLTCSFFHLAWNWLICRHRNDDLGGLAGLAQAVEDEPSACQVLHAVALSAVRTLVMDRLAARVATAQILSGESEADRVMGQLESMAAHRQQWAREMAYVFYTLPRDSAASRQIPDASELHNRSQLLEKRIVESTNNVVAGWLSDAAQSMQDDLEGGIASMQACRPSFVALSISCADAEGSPIKELHCWLKGGLSAPGHRGSLARHVLRSSPRNMRLLSVYLDWREALRHMWILPDLHEFYVWITETVSGFGLSTKTAQETTLGDVMQRLLGLGELETGIEQEDATRIRDLWIRVKVGVNMFLQHMDGCDAVLLDDSLAVFSIVSTEFEARGSADLLHRVLLRMIRSYQDFLRAAGLDHGSETTKSFSALAEFDYAKLKLDVREAATLAEREEALRKEVEINIAHLDFFGPVAKCVQKRLSWHGEEAFQLSHTIPELEDLWRALPSVDYMMYCRKMCHFIDASEHVAAVGETVYSQIYHSLDYRSLESLKDALRPIQDFVQGVNEKDQTMMTVRQALSQMYPGASEDQYFSRAYIDLSDDGHRALLLNTPVKDLPQLANFLHEQLDSDAYLFAYHRLELKHMWPDHVEAALAKLADEHLDLSVHAKELEALLIRHEVHVTQDPDLPLLRSIGRAFASESKLLSHAPLLQDLIRVFEFTGGHYVQLRRKLRAWAGTVASPTPRRAWAWPFWFAQPNSIMPCAETGAPMRGNLTPWFLKDPPEVAARKREMADKQYAEGLRGAAEDDGVAVPEADLKESGEAGDGPRREDLSQLRPQGPGRGRGRGRARGQVLRQMGAGFEAASRDREAADRERLSAQDALEAACAESITVTTFVQDVQTALQAAQRAGVDDDELFHRAEAKVRGVVIQREDVKRKLREARSSVPLDVKTLRAVLRQARAVGLSSDASDVEDARRVLRKVDELEGKVAGLKAKPFVSAAMLQDVIEEMQDLRLPSDSELETRLQESSAEEQSFAAHMQHRFRDIGGSAARDKFKESCRAWVAAESSAGWPAEGPSEEAAKAAIAKLAFHDQPVQLRKNTEAAVSALEARPLDKWLHSTAYLAAANSSQSHKALYAGDASDQVTEYVMAVLATKTELLVPAVLLAIARLCLPSESELQASCLRRCFVHEAKLMMTVDERRIAAVPVGQRVPEPAKQPLHIDTPQSRWDTLKSEPDAIPCPSIDELMGLVGLKSMKQKVLELYKSVLAEQSLPATRRVPQSHNFALLGNPGTGKTTVAKLLGKALKELGVRTSDVFITTTGERLARIGADRVAQEIDKARGGVLFVDEAYALHPAKNADAAAVAMQLLDVAEERRTDLTIILAGYKEDMETKLFDFNDGFRRRFNYIVAFEDYGEQELAAIFEQLCSKHEWPPSNAGVVQVAARRVARGRGRKGFGNAGAVRNLFENAYKRALDRDRTAKALTVVDVLGPPPTRESVPDLGRAIDELEEMIGLESVKQKVRSLIEAAAVNYERELRGETPYDVPPLNRVFLGNPGTGKTTVGKLYGRILRGIGFLTDGAWELKQPSDFIGSHEGDTPNKTKALIKRCEGKVLIIDEAYGLNHSNYGRLAIDELVGLVHGAPGEDIAVVMIGYEKQIKKMFRETNPGLARRFGLDDPFMFEDFSDAELERVVQHMVVKSNLQLARDVRKQVVKALSVQRLRPNFGNAGAAVALVARAKERLVSRDASSRELSLSDFSLERSSGDWRSALTGLSKIEHIEQQLHELRAVLEQCDRDGGNRSDHLRSYLFLGNPGTGKTTIARAMAQILSDLGILARNEIRIVTGLDLQGSYVGQTKDKVNDAMAEAQGGVLFIDEAYTLGGTHFSQEAMDQLVGKMTEPEHVNQTVVILAGYKEPMEQMLTNANPGVRSRFTGRIEFPDWDAADCVAAIRTRCEYEGIHLPDDASHRLLSELTEVRSRPGWANARDCTTTYREMYTARAMRNAGAVSTQPTFIAEDVDKAMSSLRAQRPMGEAVGLSTGPRGAMRVEPMFFVDSVIPPPQPPSPPVEVRIVESEESAAERPGEEQEEQRQAHVDDYGNGMEPIFAALLEACRQAGYDSSHDKRKDLIVILEGVQSGDPFPSDIMTIILEKVPSLTETSATQMLKPQVHRVLDGMRNAVEAEEARLEEMRKLEEQHRLAEEEAERQRIVDEMRRRQEEHQRTAERLRVCGRCPNGYTWHRCGPGWRCAGGSHYVAEGQLSFL